jgi:hypothetical protein
MTFELLKSRWTTPAWWAAARPDTTCSRMGKASRVEKRPWCFNRSARFSPASSSMVRKTTSAAAASDPVRTWRDRSKIRLTFG